VPGGVQQGQPGSCRCLLVRGRRRACRVELIGRRDVCGAAGERREEAAELPDGCGLARPGSSPGKLTAASMCWLAAARNSPNSGVVIGAGDQLADLAG
jgi:hypothetical protein